MSRLVDAGKAMQTFKADFSDVKAGSTRKLKARTVGGSRVAINTSGSASTLTSSEEISTLSTAVEDRNPEFGSSRSKATVTVHGTCTGSSDAEYEVRTGNTRGFTIGSNKSYTLKVYKNGVRISDVVIPKRYTEGDQLSLEAGSGLSISFTEEAITKKDKFYVNALTGVDVVSDPDEAFDGSTGGHVNLENTVSAGSFEINGTTVTVEDLIERVSDSDADAVMAYSATTDRLSIRHTKTDEELTVENDTTGLFTTFGIEEGTSEGKTSRGMSAKVIQETTDQVMSMVELVNMMAGTVANESTIGDGAKTARNHLRTSIKDFFGSSSDKVDPGFGLKFNVAEDSSKDFVELGSLGERALKRALRRDPKAVIETLFGTRNKDGIVQGMLEGLDNAQKTMTNRYGSVGLILDTSA